eukprot:COSAG01_NODE_4892_length_4648_cov_3.866344_2_plen_69_part_00
MSRRFLSRKIEGGHGRVGALAAAGAAGAAPSTGICHEKLPGQWLRFPCVPVDSGVLMVFYDNQHRVSG